MTVSSMRKRYVTSAVIAAAICLPCSVGMGSAEIGASVSSARDALELARKESRSLAPNANRAESARAAPGSEVPPLRLAAAREPPPEVEAAPVARVPSADEETLAAMRRDMDQLRFQVSQQQNRVAVLEAAAANEEARRARDAEETIARQRDLSAMLSLLAEIDRKLAAGSGHVSDELALAQSAAASVASSAAAAGSALQSRHAFDAQSWLAAAREPLARSDLYEARLAVNRAADCARAAMLATAVPGPDGQAARPE
jgi:colicin import membrane protein